MCKAGQPEADAMATVMGSPTRSMGRGTSTSAPALVMKGGRMEAREITEEEFWKLVGHRPDKTYVPDESPDEPLDIRDILNAEWISIPVSRPVSRS